jgi:hypothetical protein
MRLTIPYYSAIVTLFLLSIQSINAQSKFEIGLGIDPLIIPLNIGTFKEAGPGYYDIDGKLSLAHGASGQLTYWFSKSIGISLGATIRTFGASVDYVIQDPYEIHQGIYLQASHPYTATAWGPTLAIGWRKDRWRGAIGVAALDFVNENYKTEAGYYGTTVFDPPAILAHLNVMEHAYYYGTPYWDFTLQLDAQYFILDNFFVKVGFQTNNLRNPRFGHPYHITIDGFTTSTPFKEDRLLNDFRMTQRLSSFSIGVGDSLGIFGKAKNKLSSLL